MRMTDRVVLRGVYPYGQVFLFLQTKTRNWVHCDSTDKIYECMLRIPKVCLALRHFSNVFL